MVLQAFIGLAAIKGGYGLVSDPSGTTIRSSIEWLNNSPVTNYFIPGLVLLIVIGIGNVMAAAVTLLRNKHAGEIAVLVGIILIFYMSIEVWFVGLRNLLQPIYFILGVTVMILGINLTNLFEAGHQMFIKKKMSNLPT